MPRVFVCEFAHQLDGATIDKLQKEHGELVYIFGTNARRPSLFSTPELCQAIVAALESANFDANEDSLCIVGSHVLSTTAVLTIIGCYGAVNVLFYYSPDNKYVLRKFTKR